MKIQKLNMVVCVVVVLVLSMMALFSACAQPAPAPTPTPTPTPAPTITEKTINIGVINSMTGAVSSWGIPLTNSFQLAVDQINSDGGIKSGNNVFKLKLIVEDDGYTSEKAIGALTKQVFQNNCKIVLVSMVSGLMETNQQYLEQNNAVGFGFSSADPMTAKLKNIWRTVECDEFRAPAQEIQIMKDHPEIKSVSLFCVDNAAGNGAAKYFKQTVASYTPWQVKDTILFPDGTKDFQALLAKAMANKPDMLYTAAMATGDMALFIKQTRESGYKGVIMWNSNADPAILNPIAGKDNVNDVYTPRLDFNLTPALTKLMDAYKAKYGNYTSLTAYSSDCIPIIAQMIQQAGGDDGAKMIDALNKNNFTSILGPAKFTGMKTFGIAHQWLRPMGVANYKAGEQIVAGTIPMADMLKTLGEQ